MVSLHSQGVVITPQLEILDSNEKNLHASTNTLTYRILKAHNQGSNMSKLQIQFDALASHDITYVGIIQTAKASGLKSFDMPYILTNCHNSLCAVGGTINEDDHVFGQSAAEKYGGIYVPAHQAVIHQYMRETQALSGGMILGSDSHTRYGALGTMAIGEGGPELVKQLLHQTYDIDYPEVVAVYLTGEPVWGVGPQDVALSLIKAVFDSGFVKNKVLEFIGPGIKGLSVEYRNGIDVMTTETTCLSSIWMTDDKVKSYYETHGRGDLYHTLALENSAYYDSLIKIDLSTIEPMIALPFHPSHVYSIRELNENPYAILSEVENTIKASIDNPFIHFSLTDKIKDGAIYADQGIVAGCSGGTYENIAKIARLLENHPSQGYFNMSIYPSSQPVNYALMANGYLQTLMAEGINIKTAFCGPCFGAGDVPQNNGLSLRHTTRNFPNREGSKPVDGQIASVALMDALSIMATAINGGKLTPATDLAPIDFKDDYFYEPHIYEKSVYNGYQIPQNDKDLIYGPNIADWPSIEPLNEHLLLANAATIFDPVTTTDELIPSGETSSYRSNPMKLASFTLSRKDPHYVNRAKKIATHDKQEELIDCLLENKNQIDELTPLSDDHLKASLSVGSNVFALKPGDGSAREQAASCQRVLGGSANIAVEYATKRYQSNLINWGMIPFTMAKESTSLMQVDDLIFIPHIRQKLLQHETTFKAYHIRSKEVTPLIFHTKDFTEEEIQILVSGCLINYNQHKIHASQSKL